MYQYFILLSNIPLYGCVTFLSFDQLVDIWVSLFTIMSNAAIKSHMQVFMWMYGLISLGYVPSNGIDES